MTGISRVTLFGKLGVVPYQAIEAATGFARLRGNPYVELAHWLHRLLQQDDADLVQVARHFGIDVAALVADVTRALDRLPRGATAVTDFAPHVEEAIERAWIVATLGFGRNSVRSAHLLLGCLAAPTLRNTLLGISGAFGRVGEAELARDRDAILAGSCESVPADAAPAAAATAAAPGRDDALGRFASDLTARARAGGIDPVVGRDDEVRQAVDILLRRRQNNPLLVGEAGVGKTAVVEGLALRIVRGEVPPALRDVSIHALDLGLLQAGAGVRGEFEQRLNAVIEAVRSSPRPVILFIDEAHTLVGAGGAAGTGDGANLLKPALARGTLRTIAATTWSEYKRHIEPDPALTRRFQTVAVNEPDEAAAIGMMRATVAALERHHGVEILDEAVRAAVTLSRRYIPARQLPDKSLGVLDTACARVAMSQHAMAPPIEDARRRIAGTEANLDMLGRESAITGEATAAQGVRPGELAALRSELEGLEGRRVREVALVAEAHGLRRRMRDPATGAADAGDLRSALAGVHASLAAEQGEQPLVLEVVDRNAVAAVVQDWTGIPVGRMVRDEVAGLLCLETALAGRVLNQDHAMRSIARRVQTSRAGLANPARPVGVFLLCGPSGVGKTETALALADLLYGGRQSLVTINMTEFQEAHTISALRGAPPGYVGHGNGGVLTEAVRRRPHGVVLLDEMEKAHPDVHELFFQVFDAGEMEDGDGRRIDFRNSLILMTSNVGANRIAAMCDGRGDGRGDLPSAEALAEAIRPELQDVFPAALLGRLIVVPYYPLSDAAVAAIIRMQLDRIGQRLAQAHEIGFSCTDDVVALVAARCREVQSGGRMIDAILTNTLLPDISRHILREQVEGGRTRRIEVGAHGGAFEIAFHER